MEFLMTYGWSILIIAVVLGALFSMGVFSSANLAPRAPTGNCKVLRTSGTANLEGTCSGMLPQAVAQFNGGSSGVTVGQAGVGNENLITISAWVYVAQLSSYQWIIGKSQNANSQYPLSLTIESGNYLAARFYDNAQIPVAKWTNAISTGTWYQIVGEYSKSTPSNNIVLFVNGIQRAQVSYSNTLTLDTNQYYIGSYHGSNYYFNGLIANVQIYNTSLDANQVQALYQKGIGAAPIDPNHVVGWWPLNGDVNDYSGNNNNNNGAATSVTYTSSWLSGYTAP